MGKECVVCKVVIQENSWISHILGKKHRQQVARQQSSRESIERSVFVTGFHIGTSAEELINYFAKFGEIRNIIMDKNQGKFAILEFDHKYHVHNVLKQRHLLRNKILWVKPRRQPSPSNRQIEAPNIDHLVLTKDILQAKDMVDQMKRLMAFVKLSSSNIRQRQDFCERMSEVMRSFFIGCSVHLYGSSINGLGMITSDMDLHLSWNASNVQPEACNEEMSFQNIRRKVLQEKCPVSASKMAAFNPSKSIKLISTIIKSHVRGCSRVFAIMARCPIVRFYNQSLNLSCDLSTKNKLALYNSALIKFYCDLDCRVPLLLFTLRYWFKIHMISCGQGHHLSNYALTMLALFFLQNCNPPVIPITDEIQQKSKNIMNIAGWECFSCEGITNIRPSENKDSAFSLLKKFITFYQEFDFETMTVAPKTGRSIPKEELKKKFPDFKISLLCIQDPFELNHNVSASVNLRTFKRILNLLNQAKSICDDERKWLRNSDRAWGLAMLFDLDASEEQTIIEKTVVTEIPNAPVPKFSGPSSEVTFKIEISEPLKALCSSLFKPNDQVGIQIRWYKKICCLIVQILNQALFIKCKIENNQRETATSSSTSSSHTGNYKRSLKMESGIPSKLYHIQDENNEKTAVVNPLSEISDISEVALCIEDLDPPIKFHCIIFNRTWINRKKMRQQLSPRGYGSVLELEKNVSLSLIGKLSKKPLFEFTLSLDQLKSRLATGVTVTLHPLSSSKELRWAVLPFLESFLLRMVSQLLTEQSRK